MQAKNLTSRYGGAFNEYLTLTELLKNISNQNKTKLITKEDINIKSIENKVITFVDSVLSYKINETDPSYRLFNEVNKKHFLTSIYLTRVVTIIHKIQSALEKIKVADITTDKPEDEVKKIDAALQIIQKKFKRRPAEAIGLHFDVLTDVIWNTEDNYTITDAIRNMCKDLAVKSSVNIILADGKRFIAQICSKPYETIYEEVEGEIVDDIETAKQTLLDLVEMLKKEDEEVEDIFEFFNKR